MSDNRQMVLVAFSTPAEIRRTEMALKHGFHLISATSGAAAEDQAIKFHPEAAVISSTLDDMSGLELMRRFRQRLDFPVIMVGNLKDTERITALQNGVDYIIEDPFNLQELEVAVINRLARRISPKKSVVLTMNDIKIDTGSRIVTKGGKILHLSRTEWRLLLCLADHPNRVMQSKEILARVWGADYRDDLQYLRVWISRLRGKIEEDPQEPTIIKTLTGIGYMFSVTHA